MHDSTSSSGFHLYALCVVRILAIVLAAMFVPGCAIPLGVNGAMIGILCSVSTFMLSFSIDGTDQTHSTDITVDRLEPLFSHLRILCLTPLALDTCASCRHNGLPQHTHRVWSHLPHWRSRGWKGGLPDDKIANNASIRHTPHNRVSVLPFFRARFVLIS